jgi:phosphate transport system protein
MIMSRTSYQEQLDALRSDILGMGELVIERYETALKALETKDEALAREVIDGDDDINELYVDLEGDCIDLFALQQPVASDLRFVASSFKILTDLERIGDLAGNLAGYAVAAERERYPEVDVMYIGSEAGRMVAEALDAYRDGDPAVARAIAANDEEINQLCESASDAVLQDLLRTEYDDEGAEMMDDVSRLLLTIRDLERVADHAVNICARTIYVTDHDTELIY